MGWPVGAPENNGRRSCRSDLTDFSKNLPALGNDKRESKRKMNETVGLIVGFTLTVMIYSYLLGDNPLYRVAVHILTGVSAAYAGVVIVRHVFAPVARQIGQNPADLANLYWLVPLIFIVLLFLRRMPGIGWLGNLTLALLAGVGAAVALLGALTGTLIPQVTGLRAATPLQGAATAVLTVLTLLAFQFTPFRAGKTAVWQPSGWQKGVALAGRAILAVTFGALFALVLSTSLVLLASRINFYLTEFLRLFS